MIFKVADWNQPRINYFTQPECRYGHVGLLTVKEVLGHSNITATKLYAGANSEKWVVPQPCLPGTDSRQTDPHPVGRAIALQAKRSKLSGR